MSRTQARTSALLRSAAIVLTAAALCGGSSLDAAVPESVDLSGEWRTALDQEDVGIDGAWFARELPGEACVRLPGALRESGIGLPVNLDTTWIGSIRYSEWEKPQYAPYRSPENFKMPFWLQPNLHYVGTAWYQRTIEFPKAWAGKRVLLRLERPHWITTVWLDDQQIGKCDALSVPHEFALTDACEPGRHRLTLRIDNSLREINVGRNSHSVSDHTQSAWHGIVGDIELCAVPTVRAAKVQVYPQIAAGTAKLAFELENHADRSVPATVDLTITPLPCSSYDGETPEPLSATLHIVVPQGGGTHTATIALPKPVLLWDEFAPNRYRLDVRFRSPVGEETSHTTFAMREAATRGTQITINGRPIFLRGTLECCIFPKTGYPPTDVDAWRHVISRAKAYGLNHIRFHSWCPPEAAFEAADELGFYFQVECSTWPNSGASVGNGTPTDAWLYREGERIVREYGNHPSFLLLVAGNEPAGPGGGARYLEKWVPHFQKLDPRHLVSSGSGWPSIPENDYHVTPRPRIQAWGSGLNSRINARPPETTTDYRDFIAQYPDQPVVSHEIGQWCVYPNFDEIPKYTGTLKAKNFEIFRDLLENAHMLDQAHDFLMASGKLQLLCYKEEIESALRTPGFGGFQLLDLHDFPGQGTALVGVLDAFWDDKPYVSAEIYSRFCNTTVPLARMPKRIFTQADTLTATIEVAHFGPRDLEQPLVTWKIVAEDETRIAEGRFTPEEISTGKLTPLGRIEVPLREAPAPSKLQLIVGVDGTKYENDWDVWVYPTEVPTEVPEGIHVARELDDAALAALQDGGKVLLLPDPKLVDTKVALGFSSIFWNTAWTGGQAPQTLGILCDPKHPALAQFPTEYHSNWQWWELVHSAATLELDALPPKIRPIVQVVPDWFEPKRLGLVVEANVAGGKLLICSMDLSTDLDQRVVARQMRRSLLDYMAADTFRPQHALTVEQVRSLFREPNLLEKLGAKVSADSSQTGYEPEKAIDGNVDTMWHTRWEPSPSPMPHWFAINFAEPVRLAGIRVLPRQDGNPNGKIADYAVTVSADGKNFSSPAAAGRWDESPAWKTIRFSELQTVKAVRLEARSAARGNPFAAIAEIEPILAE
ncbi:discoidin domain-containing protein [Thermostilla marina]